MVRLCVEGGGMLHVDSFCAHDFAFGWFYIGGFRVDVPFYDIYSWRLPAKSRNRSCVNTIGQITFLEH